MSKVQSVPILLNKVLYKLCCGIMLRPMALVKSALARMLHNGEVCADIGLHLRTTRPSDRKDANCILKTFSVYY